MSIFNNESKVNSDSQVAWQSFQEVQGLHQHQADRVFLGGPAERWEGSEGWMEADSSTVMMFKQSCNHGNEKKYSPSHLGHPQSLEVQMGQGGQ